MVPLLDQAYFLCRQGTEAHKAASLEQLQRAYPTATAAEVEAAFDRAARLIEVACEWAEQRRGPNNDGTGIPTIDMQSLCPGFSETTYTDAGNWGLYLTK